MTFAIASTAGTGTVTIAANTAIVTGTGTSFVAGDVGRLLIVGSQWAYIRAFVSSTSVVLDAVFITGVSGAAFSLANANAAITQSGTDANLFNLSSTGAVSFKASPNYEAPDDADDDNIYNITVTGGVGSGSTIGKAIVDAIKDYERTSGAVWQGA
jgi:hypothetical protein